jgi:DmsE family decaheme c-type cytochrome
MGTAKWVHGPVGVGACTVCHNRVGNKDHEFQFAMEKEELCFACHDESRDMMLEAYRHTPVNEGSCTNCHDPHQSSHRFQLSGPTSEMCYACHDKATFTGTHVHGPVAEGDCNACHNPHASGFPQQLRSEPTEICFECHTDRDDIQQFRDSHAPVKEKCTNCHEPHRSEARYLLHEQSPGLCFGCHEELAANNSVTNPHDPFMNGTCDDCHNVHGSAQPKLLHEPLTQVCFECHDDMEEYMVAQTYKHGPIQDNDCVACHNPHGSDYNRILRKYFPKDFYVAYAEENYAICFECHNRQIALEPETETLTDFRNGKRNLHYLHVNKQEKGRSCRACHQVHASNQKKHIRVSVPYGSMKWELPVNFTQNDNGGSCQVGCHSPKEYSRR